MDTHETRNFHVKKCKAVYLFTSTVFDVKSTVDIFSHLKNTIYASGYILNCQKLIYLSIFLVYTVADENILSGSGFSLVIMNGKQVLDWCKQVEGKTCYQRNKGHSGPVFRTVLSFSRYVWPYFDKRHSHHVWPRWQVWMCHISYLKNKKKITIQIFEKQSNYLQAVLRDSIPSHVPAQP